MTRTDLFYETVPNDFSSYWSCLSDRQKGLHHRFLAPAIALLCPVSPESLQAPPAQVAACLCVHALQAQWAALRAMLVLYLSFRNKPTRAREGATSNHQETGPFFSASNLVPK